MADKLDRLIKDFVTGKLKARIEAKEIDLKSHKHEDNMGIRTQSRGISPQEAQYDRIENDKTLNHMLDQQGKLNLFWQVESQQTRDIIRLKYCKDMTWYQIASELFIGESTARRQYATFKEMLQPYI